MDNEFNHLRQFGKFRIDAKKRVLWYENEPVNLPLKEIELLCVLTEKGGEVYTKDELLNRVWGDSFVEESNLSRHIYEIRKAFKAAGESEELIQTVPRRGYRFTGKVHGTENSELTFERHSVTRTLVEEIEDSAKPNSIRVLTPISATRFNLVRLTILVVAAALPATFGFYLYKQNSEPALSTQSIKSIAVLPLRSFSTDNENEPLRLRITDALITKLGNLSEISVRPTHSVLGFAKDEADTLAAGRRLEVDAVLDGRVQIEGERLRVTLQLISVKTGAQLWSGQFDGHTNQILFLQDQISGALLPKLTREQTATFAKNPTSNPQAYELYLKGRYFWNKRTPENYWKALDHFQKAVQEDANFALAYTGIADTYILLNQRAVLAPADAYSKAEEAATKARVLDENLAAAHNSLATIYHLYHHDWISTEKHYKRAIELDPNSALTHGWYGMFLIPFGRLDEAHTILKKAEELDPTSLNISVYLTVSFYMSRQYEQAITQFQKALELEPNIDTHVGTNIYEVQAKYDDAVEAELKRRETFFPDTIESLRFAYKADGINSYWKKQIELLKEEAKNRPGLEYMIAQRYSLLGDKENTLDYIEKYSPQRGSSWSFLKVDPIWDNVRDEPRFQVILRKMNLLN